MADAQVSARILESSTWTNALIKEIDHLFRTVDHASWFRFEVEMDAHAS